MNVREDTLIEEEREYAEGEEYDEEGEEGEESEYAEDEVGEDQLNKILKNQGVIEDKLRNFTPSSRDGGGRDSNFLHVQISTNELLTKLENFYRGRVEGTDAAGNRVWVESKDDDLKTFNEFGVASMMEIVSRYIDKNTTLSSYREERIYEIIGDLGDDLVLFVLSNYKKMGMNTYGKKTKFRLLITTTCHIIESAYRRALHGETLKKLNESKAIHQFENNNRQPSQPIKGKGFFQKYFN